MSWLLLLPVFLLILLGYFLFAPFYFEVNSITGLCKMGFNGLNARIYFKENLFVFDITIVGFHIKMDSKKRQVNAGKNKVRKLKRKIPYRKILAVLKSFKVAKFYLSIDTGCNQANGILYPIFRWLSMRIGEDMRINFVNENEIILNIENNVVRAIRAYITS
jgi:hypothetical protein